MKITNKRLTAQDFDLGYCPFCGVIHAATNESRTAAYEILDDWEDDRADSANLSACPKCMSENVRVCGDCGRYFWESYDGVHHSSHWNGGYITKNTMCGIVVYRDYH